MPTEIDKLTWEDLERFAKKEQLDQDEYFLLSWNTTVTAFIWTPQTANIAVWLAPGSNEGFYVHVDAIMRLPDRPRGEQYARIGRASGKYWSVQAGMKAVDLITRFVNGWRMPWEEKKEQKHGTN